MTSYDVTCKTGGKVIKYEYDFDDSSKQVKRTRSATGETRAGSWTVEGNKLVARWENSPTVESWNYPIPASGTWTGTCTAGPACTLSAVMIIDLGTFYYRSPEAKEKFLKSCRHARRLFDVAKLKISAWLSALGITYSRAFGEHEKLMSDISAAQKLVEEFLLGFALAFVGGGVGGKVGAFMKAAGASDFMIDGVKDFAKFAVRNPTARLAAVKHNAKMPANPFEWKEGLNERMSTELAFISQQLMDWEEAVENDDVKFEGDFDPTEKMQNNLVSVNDKVSVSLLDLPEFDKDDLQIKFQQGLFVAWITNHGSTVSHIPMSRDIVRDKLVAYGKKIGLPNYSVLINQHVPNERPAFIYPSGI